MSCWAVRRVRTLETIEAERITTLFAVPTQIQEMLFHPRFDEFHTGSLRMITTGGAAISAAAMARVIEEFCPNIYNGYGMTEASLTLLLHPADALSHLGSCGKPTLISECRIIRHGSGRAASPEDAVGPEEAGELIVRGPQMMSGYWNNPIETHKKIRAGWLHTGDLFSHDAAGFFYVSRPARRHDRLRRRKHLSARGRGGAVPLPGREGGGGRRAA